jgi:hypothetical protein
MRTTAIDKTQKGSFEADLAAVRACLESWRASRKRGERIPGAIWEVVLPLARAHGINPVSKALHLDYSVLKQRLGFSEAVAKDVATDPKFVELKGPACSPSLGECRIEMEDRCGGRMSVRVALSSPSDVAAWVEAFWRRSS